MKHLLILIALFVGHQANALKAEAKVKKYVVQSSVRDVNLKMDEAAFTFIIQNQGISSSSRILYSIDKVDGTAELSSKTLSLTTTPGKHRFVLQIVSGLKEMKTGKIEAKGGHRTTVIVNFRSKRKKRRRRVGMHQVKKPVIYLYPQESTDVSIELAVKGDLTFSYPRYENGWEVTANADGTIVHNDADYNYLFWEADQEFSSDFVDQTEGFIISGNESTAFLEEQLTQFGFNGKERADFITFWAPMMVKHESIFVHFKVNQECDAFAGLDIVPTPDEIARFYILWSPIDKDFDRSAVRAQELPQMKRIGFTVLEWGGSQINLTNQLDL